MASVETDRGVKEQLRLYDTKGLHDGQDLPKHYYSVADGFVLVYSVDSLESFKRVDVLKKEIDKSRDKKEVRLAQSLLKQTLQRRSAPLWLFVVFIVTSESQLFCNFMEFPYASSKLNWTEFSFVCCVNR